MELTFQTEQKVCEIGGVKFGGQPGQYPTVVVPSIFQKGDRVFEGAKRKEGFNQDKAREMWDFKGWAGADAALEGLSAAIYHDMIFTGPMAGSQRIIPSVAMADAFLATMVFGETRKLPENQDHPLTKLFPEFVEQLKGM